MTMWQGHVYMCKPNSHVCNYMRPSSLNYCSSTSLSIALHLQRANPRGACMINVSPAIAHVFQDHICVWHDVLLNTIWEMLHPNHHAIRHADCFQQVQNWSECHCALIQPTQIFLRIHLETLAEYKRHAGSTGRECHIIVNNCNSLRAAR